LIDGYKGEISECNLTKGKGCPVCYGRTTLKGINDLWTTNPEIAKLLANPEDGYKYSKGSGVRVNWICPNCNNIIKNIRINNVVHKGLFCPLCSDGISYPEKFMYNLLNQLNINFDYQYSPKWCVYNLNGKEKCGRYDFYIPSKQAIIEMDGGLGHGNKTIKDKISIPNTIYIDTQKEILAQEYNLQVIRIDCDYKDENKFQYIKSSVLHNRQFCNLFWLSNVNWDIINETIQTSLIKNVCSYKTNHKEESTTSIGQKFDLNRSTIRRYLKEGNKLGWCHYDPHEEKYRSVINASKYRKYLQK